MSTPLVSDEQLRPVLERSQRLSDYGKMIWKRGPMTGRDVRDIYEAELKSMRDRLSRMEEAVAKADALAVHVNRVESLSWAPGDDIRRTEMIRARLDYMDARALSNK